MALTEGWLERKSQDPLAIAISRSQHCLLSWKINCFRVTVSVMKRETGARCEFIVKYKCLHRILGRPAMFYYNDWLNHLKNKLVHFKHLLLAEVDVIFFFW